MVKKLCNIYKSPNEEGLYLYVDRLDDLKRVPEALLDRFGTPELVITLALTQSQKLARTDVVRVLAAIKDKGFYLQMPLRPEDYMQELRNQNSKL